jgi:hypothetical protein
VELRIAVGEELKIAAVWARVGVRRRGLAVRV